MPEKSPTNPDWLDGVDSVSSSEHVRSSWIVFRARFFTRISPIDRIEGGGPPSCLLLHLNLPRRCRSRRRRVGQDGTRGEMMRLSPGSISCVTDCAWHRRRREASRASPAAAVDFLQPWISLGFRGPASSCVRVPFVGSSGACGAWRVSA